MSTKFSHQSGFQGTPPVCRAPPDTPISPPPPLPDTIPKVFNQTWLALLTPPFTIITNLDVYPTGKSYTWFGVTTGWPDVVEVSLELDVVAATLEITVTAKRFTHIVNVVVFHNVPLIAPDRLQTRKIEARHPAGLTLHQVQVFQ